MGLSIQHLLVVLVIVIIVFGTKRLSSLGTDLGSAIKGFRNAVKDGEKDETVAEQQVEPIDGEVTSSKKDKV